MVIHNYNQESVNVTVTSTGGAEYIDGFTGQPVASEGGVIKLTMNARTNIWLRELGS